MYIFWQKKNSGSIGNIDRDEVQRTTGGLIMSCFFIWMVVSGCMHIQILSSCTLKIGSILVCKLQANKKRNFVFEFLNIILFIFYTAGSYQLSILYILVYTCQSQSPNSSHHHQPSYPLGIHMFVLYVCLYFCFVNKNICTIFLDSTYMC